MTVLTTVACTIDATGIHAPAFEDIVATFTAQYLAIYGADSYLGNDSQDGQWIGILATAQNDTNAACVAAFNSLSPSTAQGVGLSRVVKINGIARHVASNSSVDVVIVGTVGVTITNGLISDTVNQWALPASVTIPPGATITVTATAVVAGAIAAGPGTLTRIETPTRGWVTVTNPAAATLGQPVQTDAQLRSQQSVSTAQPSQAISDGIIGAVQALPGVVRVAYFENNTDATDARGIPSHSFSLVVDGGDATAIAQAIALRKSPGAGTFGTTTITVTSASGVPMPISFFRPTVINILAAIDITALPGYATSVGDAIKLSVSNYLDALDIGSVIYWTRLFPAAELVGTANAGYFSISGLRISRSPAGPTAANIVLAFNEAANGDPANITLTVT